MKRGGEDPEFYFTATMGPYALESCTLLAIHYVTYTIKQRDDKGDPGGVAVCLEASHA